MSLQLAAQHIAARGREGDSTLVHMSPSEVASLQAIAKAHGKTLTINPETGLPEAFSLKSLIPVIAGMALGPAGLGLTIGGLSSAATAGLLTGGFEALRTGDLSKGISAGLGAYGGAGLSGSLAAAGESSLAAGDVGVEALKSAGYTPELATGTPLSEASSLTHGAANQLPIADRLSAGFDAATKSPEALGDFAKSNWKSIAAAATPALTEAPELNMPKTTTKSYYRGSSFDPYSGQYTYYDPIPVGAAEGGVMSAAQLAYENDPVIRMADGGVSLPEDWANRNPTQRIDYFNQQGYTPQQLLSANQGVTQEDINWMTGHGYTPGVEAAVKQAYGNIGRSGLGGAAEQIDPEGFKYWTGQLTSGAVKPEDFQNVFTNAVRDYTAQKAEDPYTKYVSDYVVGQAAQPTVTSQDFLTSTSGRGIQDAALADAIKRSQFSGGAQYALTHSDIGDPGNVSETYGGLKGLSSNINYWIQQHPGASLNDMRNEMKRWDLNDADIVRATGKTPEELYAGPIASVINPAEGVGGNTSAVVNPNGTITQTALPTSVTTNPVTGERAPTATIQNIKDLYTAGGGSLGYRPYAPATIEEFERKYTNTGGSKAAYDYLMGKTKYSPVPYTETGEVMKPYAENVLGMPANLENKRYIFNPNTRSYDLNPSFKPFVFDPKAPGLTSRGVSIDEAKDWLAQNPKATDKDMEKYLVTDGRMAIDQLAKLFNITLPAARKRFKSAPGAVSPGVAVGAENDLTNKDVTPTKDPGQGNYWDWNDTEQRWVTRAAGTAASGGIMAAYAAGGDAHYNLGDYSDGGRLLRGPGDGVSDDIPATIAGKRPARLADGEFVVPARIVSELGNGSTEAGARKLYAMMDRIQANRKRSVGKGKVAVDSRADKHLPA